MFPIPGLKGIPREIVGTDPGRLVLPYLSGVAGRHGGGRDRKMDGIP